MPPSASPAVTWSVSRGLIRYAGAAAAMTARAAAIAAGQASELVWLLEHPPLYTAGTSAKPQDLLAPSELPVHRTGRGGQFTYHGPGQRVIYVMLDVRARFGDVRAFVAALEDWTIAGLSDLGLETGKRQGQVGVWVPRRAGDGTADAKIAAIGVRLSRWVSSHGISLNVSPDLSHYDGIVPCGIRDAGVTSLAALGFSTDMDVVDAALRTAFERRIATTVDGLPPPVEASEWDRETTQTEAAL
jgi:lipoyl(octanoyl) transferase